jgi:DNA-directed RNA polymerase subunit H (RpoH/RPB5)
LGHILKALGLQEKQWRENMQYFNNNPQLKVQIDAHAKEVGSLLKDLVEAELSKLPAIETEEEVLKFVEMRETKMLELFRDSVLRYDRQYNFERQCEDDLVRVHD